MSKGLETLKNIFSHWNCCNPNSNGCYEEDFEIIAKELKELEERRKMMRRFNEACVPMILDNQTEKKLKALEIIKELATIDLLEELNDDEPYWLDISCSRKISKETYELLKEELL